MRETMLILHLIGLAMGLGTSFAHVFLGNTLSKLKQRFKPNGNRGYRLVVRFWRLSYNSFLANHYDFTAANFKINFICDLGYFNRSHQLRCEK